MAEGPVFAPYRAREFHVRGSFCDGEECAVDPELSALQFRVKEVFGTSAKVVVGERYVVRGEYCLPGAVPYAISIAVFSKAFGATAHLSPGEGQFETSAEILKFTDSAPSALGIVVASEKTGKCDIVRWLMLKAQH